MDTMSVCEACMSHERLLSLNESARVDEDLHLYVDMFLACFNLEIVQRQEDTNLHYVCEYCAHRLTEAARFRTQVVRTQALLAQARLIKREDPEVFDVTLDYSLDRDGPLETKLEVKLDEDALPENGGNTRAIKKNCRKIKKKTKEMLQNETKPAILKPKRPYHPRNLPKVLPMDEATLTCKLCIQKFDSLKLLRRHMATHYPRHLCHACGAVFLKKEHLKRHAKTHIFIQCAECGLRLNESSIAKHNRTHHSAVKPKYQCTECREKFPELVLKNAHVRTVHGINTDIRCVECEMSFAWKRSLNTHMRRVHRREVRAACRECGKRFFDASGLAQHMLTHTGERRYECEVCNKRFQTKNCVKTHMRFHMDAREFICAVCARDFKYSSCLAKHMKRQHLQ